MNLLGGQHKRNLTHPGEQGKGCWLLLSALLTHLMRGGNLLGCVMFCILKSPSLGASFLKRNYDHFKVDQLNSILNYFKVEAPI